MGIPWKHEVNPRKITTTVPPPKKEQTWCWKVSSSSRTARIPVYLSSSGSPGLELSTKFDHPIPCKSSIHYLGFTNLMLGQRGPPIKLLHRNYLTQPKISQGSMMEAQTNILGPNDKGAILLKHMPILNSFLLIMKQLRGQVLPQCSCTPFTLYLVGCVKT